MENGKSLNGIIGSGLSRRSLLKGSVALGMGMTAGGLILPARARAAEPKRGGKLTVAHAQGSTTDSFDPGVATTGFLYSMLMASHNFLTEIAADGSLVPELAEGWEASPDATVWTFRLRSGVTFHDGRPVTSKDVVASINHHRGEASTSSAKPLLDGVADVAADGDTAVIITLKAGNADLPLVVSSYQFPILPEKDGKMDWESGVGCGGYVIKAFVPGVSAQLERFDGYWKKDRAWFDAIEIITVADTSARMNALITGQAQLISAPDLKFIDRLKQTPGIVVEETHGNSSYGFPVMVNTPPFNDKNVVLALKHSINREEIVQKILLGHGTVGNDTLIGPAYRYRATEEELPQRTYDPEKAKFHLKKAGLGTLKVQLNVADAAFAGAVDAALLYQASAKASGIDIEVVREPDDGYWSSVWNVKPFTAVYWNGYPTEDMILSTANARGAAWNATKMANDRFDELIVKARSELDEKLRREMYVEAQKIVNEDDGAITPMFNNFIWARSDKLANSGQLAANFDIDGHRWGERWWFA
jgi:peptide/nickel transport system substrate-binding protein